MKAHNTDGTSVVTDSAQWLLWVDNEIWGYASTLDDAQWFLTKISQEIKTSLQTENPLWIIKCLTTNENTIEIKCLHPGWTYNSKWVAHTVRYETINKLIREPTRKPLIIKEIPTPPTPPPMSENAKPKARRNRRRQFQRRARRCH